VASSNLQRLREERMMSKAELARRSGLSTLTINRVEAGRPCRLETKRKILQALQLGISDQERVFGTQGASAARASGAESRA
jgi:DNA-binding XRE family transcriptional regulator